ncbi:HlyD family type I secretion periplasmic adaptor subunit [Pseudanabaenaceae cyanobacterium LEGE 13415]|nr:HlyD family type I secretion periplasmic adaptor subunit [Pseudanabaenaceae cyanobacterium LEGE 13415]
MQKKSWFTNFVRVIQGKADAAIAVIDDRQVPQLELPQPANWAKRTTQVIMFGLVVGLGWSIFARMEVVVTARGKLEPLSSAQSVQPRFNGVISAVLVKEGQKVRAGQVLMQLDKGDLLNQLKTLSTQRELLVKQVAVLRLARQGQPINAQVQRAFRIPPELYNRVQNRQLLTAQLTGNPSGLSPDQLQRYRLFVRELQDVQAENRLQLGNLRVQESGANSDLTNNSSQLRVEQELVARLNELVKQGAISRTDYLRRVVGVNDLQNEVNQSQVQRGQIAMSQIQAQVSGRKAIDELYRNVQDQLAQLDNQLDSSIEASQQRIIQLNGQLQQLRSDLKAQELRSPVDGVVFDIKQKVAGTAVRPGDVLMQISPDESLVANVQVANSDIADLRVGLPVDVRLDAYPFTEFGSIQGAITRISSDAVPVSEQSPNAGTVFPVTVVLKQSLQKRDKKFSLSPGMTLNANIKVRSRAPISLVADQVVKLFDSTKNIR